MPDIRIAIGKPCENMSEERRIDTEAFAEELTRKGLSVEVDIAERVQYRIIDRC